MFSRGLSFLATCHARTGKSTQILRVGAVTALEVSIVRNEISSPGPVIAGTSLMNTILALRTTSHREIITICAGLQSFHFTAIRISGFPWANVLTTSLNIFSLHGSIAWARPARGRPGRQQASFVGALRLDCPCYFWRVMA